MPQYVRMQNVGNIGNTRELRYSKIHEVILAMGKITFTSRRPRNQSKLLTEKNNKEVIIKQTERIMFKV